MLSNLGDNRLARFLAPPKLGAMAWLEAPLLVVMAVLVGFLVRPDDPLIFQGGIRWSIVVVLLVALRYGSLLGSLGMLTLLLAWFACKALGCCGYPMIDWKRTCWFAPIRYAMPCSACAT